MKKLYCAGIVFLGSQGVAHASDLHLVKKGETLFKISEKYYQKELGLTPSGFYHEMLKYNSFIKNPNQIYPGQSIILPKFDKLTYKVRAGDTLSKIIENHSNSFPALKRKEKIARIQELNPHIKDLNRIYPGDLIQIGFKVSYNVPSEFAYYRMKKNEYVFKVIENLYGSNHSFEYLDLVKELNPQIPNINLVYVDQIIRLPARKDIQRVVASYSKRTLASVAYKNTLNLNSKKLKKEIFNLNASEANTYVELFKKFKDHKNKKEWIESLEEIQAVSISKNHSLIERTFSEITEKYIDLEEERLLKLDLKNFLYSWKETRMRRKERI